MSRVVQRILLVVLLTLPAIIFADDLDKLLAQARSTFDSGDFAAASALLSSANAQFPNSNASVAETYTAIGKTEYDRKNYKNAYTAFREALKLQPTNQSATQYYLRMRREMDITRLTNEFVPPVSQASVPNLDSPSSPGDTAASIVPTVTEQGLPSAADEETDLKILIAQLKAAENRISTTESTASSVRTDNELLRSQLESQRQLVEKMLTSQRTTTVAPSAVENAKLQETIRLLSMLAEKDADRPIVVQSDPVLQGLLQELNKDRQEDSNPFSARNILSTASLIVMFLFLLVIVVVVIIIIRSRRMRRVRPVDPYANSYSLLSSSQEGSSSVGLLPSGRSAGLLEYASQGTDLPAVDDIGLRAALLKADHLQKMYNDVKTGTLNWETIRTYIDDLEKSLRVEILRAVEAKLDSGALITPETALPILFPFLTDYDDFLNDKAHDIAKKALLEGRSLKDLDDSSPLFSIQTLLKVPSQLNEVLKQKDRSLVTAKLALGIARIKGLSKDECDLVYKGALTHDVGYLLMDKNQLQRIISKPEIDEEDWSFIKSHVEKGLDYFNNADMPQLIKEAILHHHERNDGSGYPNGLLKDDIPLVAQIIGVSETFASLVASRSYRDKLEVSHALAVVKDGARRKFDHELVAALEKVILTNGGNL